MAQTPVLLQVDGYQDREVQKVEYSFNKATDDEGQLTGIVRGGKITFVLKALNDGNPDMLDWMVQRNLAKNGVIVFNETKTNSEMKKIEFTNAYCVNYKEDWQDKKMHTETFTISCQSIKFTNIEYTNNWK